MKKQWHALLIVLFAILLTVLACTFAACGSKKKIVEKESIRIEKSDNTSADSSLIQTVQNDSVMNSRIKTFATSRNESIEAVAANDSTPVDVSKQTDGNITKWKIKGAKSFKINNDQKQESSEDTTSKQVKSVNFKKKQESETKKTVQSIKANKRNTDSSVKRISTWFYVIGGIAVLLLLLWIIKKMKKSSFLSWFV